MRRAARILGIVALALGLLGAGGLVYARSETGRRHIADAVERVVSKAIPGRLTIGRLVELGAGDVVVADVRFLHPDGSLILLVKRVAIDFDLAAALHGELAFHHAHVDGGYLLVAARPSGRTGLEEAFDDGISSKDPNDHGLRMQLRDIQVEHMTAVFKPSPDHPFRLRDVRGVVVVEHLDTKGARVRLEHIRAEMNEPSFLGKRLAIDDASGWVHGAEVQVLDLKLATRLGEGKLDGHLAYYDRKKTPVEIELHPKSGVAPYVAAFAVEAQSWFTDTLDVHVRD